MISLIFVRLHQESYMTIKHFPTRNFVVIFAMVLGLASCTYNSEEDLYPVSDCPTNDMSYTNDILPIIESNCYVCHSDAANFGNVTLEGHANLLVRVNDDSLLGSIRHEDGWSPMPSGAPQLLECQINQISAWIDQGAPNN